MKSDLATRVIEAINSRDHSAIETLTTDDVQLRVPPGQVFFGQAGIHSFFEELESVLATLTVTARRTWTGMGFTVVEFDSAGRSASNLAAESMGALVLELVDDRISRIQVYLDTAQWDSLHWQALTRG